MKPKTKLALIVIFTMMVNFTIPLVSAADFERTQTIQDPDAPGTDADCFVTETGIGFHTDLVTITDPNLDIYGYLFFEDIKINYWHSVINATLRLRTASPLSFDADSKVTIYGVNDYIHFGSGTKGYGPLATPSEIMNAPLTEAFVVFNTSQFYGPQWWEINVTNIVQELKSNPNWDGPGLDIDDPGDNMAFIIVGASGYDTRYFYDLRAGNDYEAQLNYHWTTTPRPPSGGGTFNTSYRTYNIFATSGKEKLTTEFYTWTNPRNAISLVNDYYLNLDAYGWDTWYNPYAEHQIERIVNFNDYTDSMEVRFYTKIINEYTISHRPDWWFLQVRDETGDTLGIEHRIDPSASDDKHYLVIEQNDAITISTVFYSNDGDSWWTRFLLNKTHVSTATWTGIVEPEWDTDPPDMSQGPLVQTYTEGDDNFTDYFRIAQSREGTDTYTGKTDMQIGYFSILLDDVPQLDISWAIVDENGTTVIIGLDDLEDAFIYIDEILGDDPDDPDPPGQDWDPTGPFTRFKTRLYIFLMGFGMIWGPLMVFAYRRPTGYAFVIGLFVMLIGLGFLIHAGTV